MFLSKQIFLFLIIIQITLQNPKLKIEEECECEYSTLHQDWNNPIKKPNNITEICEYVKECCQGKYFTILKLLYCSKIHISIVLTIIIIIILLSFYFLSSTGNDYLANVLGRISEKLKLSQNLAGLTLLALGNQAPDIAVAIVAGEGANEGFSTALGSLLGGGGLVVGLVCSSVIILGKGVKVYLGNYIRDIGIYIIALFVIVCFGIITQKIYFWMSWVIFFMYIIYVIICIIMDQKGKEKMNMEKNELNKSFLGDKDFLVKLYDESQESYIVVEPTNEDEKTINDDFNESTDNRLIPEDDNNKNNENNNVQKKIKKFNMLEHINKSYFEKKRNEGRTSLSIEYKLYSKFRYDLIRYYMTTDKTNWEDKSIIGKIMYIIIDFPFNFLRDCTIPAFEEKKWKRLMFIFLPISLSIFFTLIFNLYSIYQYKKYIIIYYIICIIICIIFFRKTYRGSLPKQENTILFSAFIISILWIWAITNILMDMITAVKMIIPIEIPESFLSMTVLALGNSLPDFIVDCSLAKTGFAEMALSGAIGAPVFGITFGLGVSLIKKMIVEGIDKPIDFAFDFKGENAKNNLILVCGFVHLFLVLFMLMIMGFINKFVIKPYVGYIGYVIYTLFIISIVYFTFLY